MRRRFSILAVTAVMAGGVLFTAVPAQAHATTIPSSVAIRKAIVCKPAEMRQKIANLKAKAARLKGEGERAAARRALAKANAIQRKLEACRDAEENL
jgi:hypothetical protein